MLPELLFTLYFVVVVVIAKNLPSQSHMAEPHSTSKGICIAQNLPIRPPKRREKRPLHPLDPLIRISSVEDHFAIGICLEEFLDEEVTRGAEHALTYHAFG